MPQPRWSDTVSGVQYLNGGLWGPNMAEEKEITASYKSDKAGLAALLAQGKPALEELFGQGVADGGSVFSYDFHPGSYDYNF